MRTGFLTTAAMALVWAAAISCNANRNGYDAEGYFEAVEVTVSAEANGRILEFGVEEGADVKAGVPVGCIDTVQLYLSKMQLVKSAESVLESRPDVDLQVLAMKEQVRMAERERDRVSRLFSDGAATSRQMDEAQSRLSVLEVQLEAQEKSLNSSVSSIDAQCSSIAMQIAQTEDRLEKCRIKSPVDGIVLTKYAQAGEFASVGKPLFKVADLENIYLRAYVTSAQLSGIRLGQEVKVWSDYGKGFKKEYPGVITWISDASEFTPKNIQTEDERKNLVYAVKVSVVNDGLIKLGMYGGIVF